MIAISLQRRSGGRIAALVLLLAALLGGCDTGPATALPPPAAPSTATTVPLPPTLTIAPTNVPLPSATVPAAPSATLLASPTLIVTAATSPPAASSPSMVMTAPTSPPTGPTPTNPPGIVNIQILDFYFAPAVITVPLGTKIVWTNIGPTEHTVADLTMRVFSSDILPKGASFSWTPDRVGTIPYWCTIHPDMKATLIVTR